MDRRTCASPHRTKARPCPFPSFLLHRDFGRFAFGTTRPAPRSAGPDSRFILRIAPRFDRRDLGTPAPDRASRWAFRPHRPGSSGCDNVALMSCIHRSLVRAGVAVAFLSLATAALAQSDQERAGARAAATAASATTNGPPTAPARHPLSTPPLQLHPP